MGLGHCRRVVDRPRHLVPATETRNLSGDIYPLTPFVYLYDRTSAVKLGDSGEEFIQYRFRTHGYARAFAVLNGVQTQNAETLEAELEEAILRFGG